MQGIFKDPQKWSNSLLKTNTDITHHIMSLNLNSNFNMAATYQQEELLRCYKTREMKKKTGHI